jgi:hypothetical protein
MANPNQPVLLDAMIARLEKANAGAYEKFARPGEGVLKSNQDAKSEPTEQQDLPGAPKRRSSRAKWPFIFLIALLLAASAFATAIAWEPSYGETAKFFVRQANSWVLQIVSQAQTTRREGDPAVSPLSPDVARQLQAMAADLANMKRQIEQLRTSQEQTSRNDAEVAEQFKTSQQQMVRDNAKMVEQLNAALAQMDRQNAAVARQLKANQEQLADLASLRASSVWRHPKRSPSR